MGWASGSEVMGDIIDGIKPIVPDASQRTKIYIPIIKALEDADWDTQYECMDMDDSFVAAINTLHPEWDEVNE